MGISADAVTTLVVLAHPERRSFNGAWADATLAACNSLDYRVLLSDLGSGFDPIERAAHYAEPGAPFDVLKTQEHASASSELPADVRTELDKVEAADRIVFHFPLWWFSPPAMLKGWCERVLVHGRTHSVDRRFDTGRFRGRTVLFCATTGASQAESAPDGKEGDTRLHLWPLAYTMRYLGFDVLEPVIVHGVHGYHEGEARQSLERRLGQALGDQGRLMRGFDALPLMQFNADSDFGPDGRLKRDAPSYSPFIRKE